MAATHGPNDLAIRRETGARIRARRTALGLTQTALAEACGTDEEAPSYPLRTKHLKCTPN